MLDITSRLLRFVYEVFKCGASARALSRKAEQRDAVASEVCKQVCHLMAVSLTQLAPCAVLLQIERRFILHTLKIEPYAQAHAIARHRDALHLDPISGAVFVSGAQRDKELACLTRKARKGPAVLQGTKTGNVAVAQLRAIQRNGRKAAGI